MKTEQLLELITEALEELKGNNIRVLDVRGKTSITDYMVIASGTSERHVRALAQNVAEKAKHGGVQPLGVEGENAGDWVLVDLTDAIVHVMTPATRDFYNLEKLWDVDGGITAEQAGGRA
ncbi:MAG: ribosome silencing factor [Chromatiales bacterium]|nr:ribosome silencing factor [Chromatiales bacterium]